MNVCVIGTGYVGLVTGAVFADLGNDVTCVDKIKEKIEKLQKGIMPIYEPGLEEVVLRNMREDRLSFSTEIDEAIRRAKVVFIAVGTPPRDNGETDLSQVEGAARYIARNLNEYKVIVNKSTVPVGTGDLVRSIIDQEKKNDVTFAVVSNPEFLREGSAIQDCLYPDRIVIGAPNQEVAMVLLELYAPLERPMLITNVESAEMIKYASNAFLATKISFINMVANLCEKTGADVQLVAKGMGYDNRIGTSFLQAGLGFGGSCFPKDTLSLIHTAKKFGEHFTLLEEVVRINELRVPLLLNRIEEKVDTLQGKVVGILGLAFKPNTDDLREAKSLQLIRELLERKCHVKAYDPVAMEGCKQLFPQVEYCENAYKVAEGADVLLIVTDWNEFKQLNLGKIKKLMRGKLIADGRNIYIPNLVRQLGFDYLSIGRS